MMARCQVSWATEFGKCSGQNIEIHGKAGVSQAYSTVTSVTPDLLNRFRPVQCQGRSIGSTKIPSIFTQSPPVMDRSLDRRSVQHSKLDFQIDEQHKLLRAINTGNNCPLPWPASLIIVYRQ